MHHPHVASGGRYPVLRSVAILFLVGTLAVIGTGIYGLWWEFAEVGDSIGNKLGMSAVILAGTFFSCLITIGVAELIKLAIDIEHNTRMAAEAAHHHGAAPAPAAVAASADGTPVAGGRVATLLDGDETAEGALLRGH